MRNAGPGPVANAATLLAGDVVVLGRFPIGSLLPQTIIVVAPTTGALEYIDLNPRLTDMQDFVIRDDGEILVSDGVQGLVSVSALDGTWQPRFALAAFGGTAPSALALAPNGDLLAAGMFGIMRLVGGTGAPQQVSMVSFVWPPQGLTTDGGANIWVTGEQLLRVDPATGESSVLRKGSFMVSFAFDASGTDWVCSADNIRLTPYGGFLEGAGLRVLLDNRGPVAIVPPGVPSPARRSTWGALKQLYR